MVRIDVEVDWVRGVEKDVVLYDVPQKRFDGLRNVLSENPLIGRRVAQNMYELESEPFIVRYFLSSNGRMVTIMQIRPLDSEQPIISKRVRQTLREISFDLLKQGVRKWLGF